MISYFDSVTGKINYHYAAKPNVKLGSDWKGGD